MHKHVTPAAMAIMYLSGIAHPPPGKGTDDLPPHVFQSSAFIAALIGCPVTGDSGHGNTARAGRLILASGQALNGESATSMIDMLAKCANNPTRATCGRVSDAWVGRDGALRVTLAIDESKITNLTKTAITTGILNGISISHHESDTGTITPFETGLCLRPLRDRCYVHAVDTPNTYKFTSKIKMASASSAPEPEPDVPSPEVDMSGLPEELKQFASVMMGPITDETRESILESFTGMYRKKAEAEKLIEAQKLENEARRVDDNRAALGLIESAMKQLGAEITAEDRKQFEELGNVNPVLMRNLGGQLVTAANSYRRREESYKPSSRVIGIMQEAAPAFDNVSRSAQKRPADAQPAEQPASKRDTFDFMARLRQHM